MVDEENIGAIFDFAMGPEGKSTGERPLIG
ncbi:hypothetical protein L905_14585 [Agrobacterium sp. TS43]|nr:hypothetical protein L902_23835 [Agrobacterium radiobacter DSM 30147]KVK46439.1 hypothetical protein L904_23495 [Agrobacterium sp. LY4]KVK46538.1 hypothetical protein L903_23440 [Agrobacterium sp. JL28]KVK60938.1 hypothetical protein L906_22565 [Agrobacterium sp. TS45]KVK65437.1 hypothetical protein L907_22525 [Agrobacterium sp. C13]KVK69293.1 hypothetical protein L905_14585 [Agrobacterium sp. TS43]